MYAFAVTGKQAETHEPVGKLDMDAIYLVLEEEKPNQREQIRIRSDRLNPYFPKDYTDRQKIELIESLVKEWHQEQMQSKGR